MLNIALIVFRETLEAALFVGVVAACTLGLPRRQATLTMGIALGVLGSLVLASVAQQLSGALGGMGADVVSAGILTTAIVMIAHHCITSQTKGREAAQHARALARDATTGIEHSVKTSLQWSIAIAVALTVLREGAETILFVAGAQTAAHSGDALNQPPNALMQTTALLIGLSMGSALGYAVYRGLKGLPIKQIFQVSNALLMVMLAAMASQLAKLSLGAGWVSFMGDAAWDTSHLLSVNSILGTLLKFLVGYDDHPSLLQVVCYASSLILVYSLTKVYTQAKTI